MKEKIKEVLKAIHFYHPLQSFYRSVIQFSKRSYYRYAYAKFKGSGFTCNVCQSAYRKFVDRQPADANRDAILKNHVIAGYGENILCPHCMSTARERLVLAMLPAPEIQGKKILHFSPEKKISDHLRKFASVISADLSPGFYRNIDKKIVKADATELAFPDAKFDIVIANHIMEHIPDDVAAMKEVFRILKPGGRAVLQVPYSETIPATLERPDIYDPVQQAALFGQKDHVRIYKLDNYIHRLTSVGFDVLKVPFSGMSNLFVNAIQKNECFLQIIKPIS